jgi:hypothetical protein
MFDFLKWCQDQNPITIPFRPGASYTTLFGLRNDQSVLNAGGSPGHLGVDRGEHDRRILMPFDGFVFWKKTGGVTGSLLQLIPRNYEPVEIQIFHSVRSDGKEDALNIPMKKGETLPIETSNIGLSLGKHTHTEVVIPYSFELDSALKDMLPTKYVQDDIFYTDNIKIHCHTYKLDYNLLRIGLEAQIDSWAIQTLTDIYAVRQELPRYRRPHWGRSATIHVDSRRFLQI